MWREEQRRERKQLEHKATKPLLVKRLFNGVWYKHIVRDPSVINAYVKQRQEIEEQSIVTESLMPTGDAALDAMRKKRLEEEIAARVKNQDRRLQRLLMLNRVCYAAPHWGPWTCAHHPSCAMNGHVKN